MRKFLVCILVLALMAACICSCGNKTDTESDDGVAETLTDSEVITILKAEAELNRYLDFGAMKCGSRVSGSEKFPEKKFYKCDEEDKDEWSEWEAYVKSIYCSDAAESALGSYSIVNIDGFTYSDWDDGPREYGYTDEFVFTQESSGDRSAVYTVTNPSVYEDGDAKVGKYTFTCTADGWRISSVE